MTEKPTAEKSKKSFKYIGSSYINQIFNLTDKATVKCSVPKEFNDPYELFLTIDFNKEPQELAYYLDAIGELPQLPTTCFSRSPIVIPMWAHYAQNHQGFILEFSEDELQKIFPECSFEDVDYADTPVHDLSELLSKAYHIGKMRYTYFLRRAVFVSAYFTKTSCWSYEQERRLVLPRSYTRDADTLILLDAPRSCVTNIICGSRASEQTRAALAKLAEEAGCGYFELRIGKSSAVPYLIDKDGQPFLFDGAEIVPCHQHCEKCQEPTELEVELCSWCQINDELRQHVASRNPFRMLDRFGLLDSYVAGMDAVGSGVRRKKE